MQLDSTRIAIRERRLVDILDLALHVLRYYFKPLMLTCLLIIIPLMLINHTLLGWLLSKVDFKTGSAADAGRAFRFVVDMLLLIFMQAPLISVAGTVFLGRAVFDDPPKIRTTVKEVFSRLGQLIWVYGITRGVGIAMIFLLTMPRRNSYSFPEALLVTLAIWTLFVRAMRPFINEIILLERTPLTARRGAIRLGKRSSSLHGPSGSDLFLRWIGSAFFGILLFLGFFGLMIFISGVLFNDWQLGPLMIKVGLPFAAWMVAIYFTVVRYLCYLDLRIRHEGWEVDLRLRAEAVRLSSKFA